MPPVDEGMIHAWLDGALSADEAARIEALVASDPAWSAAAAEARGLMAASSRILSSLDAVPANVLPASIPTVRAAHEAPRVTATPRVTTRRWRTPQWAAAATLVMAVGAGVLWRSTPEAERPAVAIATDASKSAPGASVAPAASTAPVAPVAPATPSVAAPAAGRANATELAKLEQREAPAAVATRGTASPVAAAPSMPTEAIARSVPEPAAKAAMAEAVADERAENAVALTARARRTDAPMAARAMAAPAAAATMGAMDAAGASQSVRVVTPVCWTVRLSGWTPPPTFVAPIGVLLDSTRAGSAREAVALIGGEAPPAAKGQWTETADSLRVTVDRVVLGYTLRVAMARSTMAGRAALGDAATPLKATATATMLPSRCAVP